jgi:hypothetical protein
MNPSPERTHTSPRPPLTARLSSTRGQSLLEFGISLPVLLLIVLAVSEIGLALRRTHTVTRLTREASNLISRGTSLEDAAVVLETMGDSALDFKTDAKIVLSVIKRGATTGTSNYDQLVLYQRYEFGSLPAQSKLKMSGSGAFDNSEDHVAIDSDNNAGLRVTNVPGDLIVARGGLLYVTELFSANPPVTPLARLGVSVAETLYSIAYF